MKLSNLAVSSYLYNQSKVEGELDLLIGLDVLIKEEDSSYYIELHGRRVAGIYHFPEVYGGTDNDIHVHYADGGSEVFSADADIPLTLVKYTRTELENF